MLGSHRLSSIIEVHRQSCTMVVFVRCAGPLYFFNLSWFPVSDYIKNLEYVDDRKFIKVYVCQKLS